MKLDAIQSDFPESAPVEAPHPDVVQSRYMIQYSTVPALYQSAMVVEREKMRGGGPEGIHASFDCTRGVKEERPVMSHKGLSPGKLS
jgi:hypothetical protein